MLARGSSCTCHYNCPSIANRTGAYKVGTSCDCSQLRVRLEQSSLGMLECVCPATLPKQLHHYAQIQRMTCPHALSNCICIACRSCTCIDCTAHHHMANLEEALHLDILDTTQNRASWTAPAQGTST